MNKTSIKRALLKLNLIQGHLPNLFILGAQKAATSSLNYYLAQHPSISGGSRKEMHFFDNDVNYSKGTKWYKSQFLHKAKYRLDSTPSYLYEQHVPERVKATLGDDALFIILLREPISRSFSAYHMYCEMKNNPQWVQYFKELELQDDRHKIYSSFFASASLPSFEEVIEEELNALQTNAALPIQPGLVRRGFYVDQIKHWQRIYPERNFLFLDKEALQEKNLRVALKNVSSFLGIVDQWCAIKTTTMNRQDYQSKEIEPETKKKLIQLYREKNEGLGQLTGLDLSWESL